jgi:hypothetical protein
LFHLIKFQHFSVPAFLESCVPKQLLRCLSFHLSCYLLIKTDIHITVSISHTCRPCIFLFQSIYPAKILKLNFRERKENAWEDSGSDELSVVFPSVIGRFDGADLQVCVNTSFIFLIDTYSLLPSNILIRLSVYVHNYNLSLGCLQNMLQKSFQDVKSRIWKDKFEADDADDEGSFGKIPFQIWNISKFSSCVDAAIAGLMPPPLLELQVTELFLLIIIPLLLDVLVT